ncbi:hypothetical protein AB6A40_008918 [Gnathostoma spinigerum]|uniref:Uncharacterized protein n=1 Tax=Gnathostoma spinigerum TaxID=75299 RepID=A0ABD6EVJ2_9BILA
MLPYLDNCYKLSYLEVNLPLVFTIEIFQLRAMNASVQRFGSEQQEFYYAHTCKMLQKRIQWAKNIKNVLEQKMNAFMEERFKLSSGRPL